ncbi:hypothetical protein HPB51_007995 [Rhipicephalus microplus]|uniref:Uncharacterized protein n=1 Tax=Rhipicephalus microplus TaxID=6941 RepID=A0A9J6DFW8_RHIMP|nr:hypothetical protein HPB51_007995 [Rhipicephalus microplus]
MQEVVKPGSSNNRKQSRRARATKKPGPTPVANKDSQPGSSRGVPSEKPEDGDIKEPDEVDPKAVYQDALKEVEGLESIINKLNSGKIYIGRSHEIEVRKLCLALHEFCSRKARNPDVRKRMLDAVRHELSISCPLFVWEEVEFSAPVEQPLQLTMEAEIRFGSDISALEEKLRKMAVVLSTALNRDFTIRAVCEYLDEGTSPSLITEGLVPVDNRDNSPRIYTMNGRLWIYTGSPGKTVEIASGRMERALVLCLVLYYIKYIDYPEAFWRVMYVLQFVLIPSDPPPPVPTRKNVPVCQPTDELMASTSPDRANLAQIGWEDKNVG